MTLQTPSVLIRLEQDEAAAPTLVKAAAFERAAVRGRASLVEGKRAVVVEMSQSQIVDPAPAQGAHREDFGVRSRVAVPHLSMQHDDVEAGGIKIGGRKRFGAGFPAGNTDAALPGGAR